MAKEKDLLRVAPYYLVDDVVTSAEWWRDKLGFSFERYWGEPPSFVMLHRDGLVVMLKEVWGLKGNTRPNRIVHENACWDAYFWVADADRLYTEFKARGVRVVREIENTFYGCRDFDVEDCNGYVFCFGQDLDR